MTRFLRQWLPVLFWMGLTFLMSTDLGSAAHTSRFIEPLLHWLAPGIAPDTVEEVHFLIRKAAHLSEYAVMALLCVRAMTGHFHPGRISWSWSTAAIAWLISASYAAGDEFHQSFVPSRGASVRDVMIDSSGALIGLTIAWVLNFRKTRRSRP